ncbi:MAG: hypothetical protein D6813_07940, partial [Calditrichaeota bacterium]
MNVKFKIVCFILTWISTLLAQQPWQWQNPKPQGNPLWDIQAVSSTVGYAAGEQGSFLKTVNAGIDWELLSFPRRIDINKIQFINENLGWVAGQKENQVYLYQTSDGGISWKQQLKLPGDRISIFFLDKKTGWVAVDSTIYYTIDSGKTFEIRSTLQSVISYLYFLDPLLGWLVGGNRVYKTGDGGYNWQVITLQSPYYRLFLQKVIFINENIGWAIGSVSGPNHLSGHLFKTSDGGLTWEQQLNVGGSFVYNYFTDMEFKNELTGWAIAGGWIFFTNDGGEHWDNMDREDYLTQITHNGKSTLWGCGYLGVLLTSTDGGLNWTRRSSDTILDVGEGMDLFMWNHEIGFASASKALLKTTDEGQTWKKIKVDDFGHDIFDILAVWFNDPLHGWIGTSYGSGWGGLYRTFDGGHSWSSQIDSLHRIFNIYFVNDSLGWFVSGNKIFHTKDGGDSWFVQWQDSKTDEFMSIQFVTPDSGWAACLNRLLETHDGGINWSRILPRPEGLAILDLQFINSQDGWVIGYYGNDSYIYKTSDGGLTWVAQSHFAPIYARPRSVYFIDKNHGWVVGSGFKGKILYTSNGGRIWQEIEVPTNAPLYRVHFTDPQHGWILGHGGIILNLFNGIVAVPEITEVENSFRFTLYPNYPNPFTPLDNFSGGYSQSHGILSNGVNSETTIEYEL